MFRIVKTNIYFSLNTKHKDIVHEPPQLPAETPKEPVTKLETPPVKKEKTNTTDATAPAKPADPPASSSAEGSTGGDDTAVKDLV